MLSLYTGLGLYAVSTAFVVPCLTTLVSQVWKCFLLQQIIGKLLYVYSRINVFWDRNVPVPTVLTPKLFLC